MFSQRILTCLLTWWPCWFIWPNVNVLWFPPNIDGEYDESCQNNVMRISFTDTTSLLTFLSHEQIPNPKLKPHFDFSSSRHWGSGLDFRPPYWFSCQRFQSIWKLVKGSISREVWSEPLVLAVSCHKPFKLDTTKTLYMCKWTFSLSTKFCFDTFLPCWAHSYR